MCDSSIAYGVIALGIELLEKEMKKDQYYRSRDEVFSLGRSW